jgi:H+/Cl- antiporter ClcA
MTEPQTSGTDAEWLPAIASAAVIGGIGAIAALAFSAVIAAGQRVLWVDEVDPAAFSGSWRIVAILTGAGLLVGVIHRLDPMAREENAFAALGTGSIDLRPVPGGVLISVVSLIGGFSLGPEVPTGMAAAGIATWWGRRRGRSQSQVHADTTAAITGAWGGLFTTPFVGTLLSVELSVGARILDWRRIAADATAAVVGFSVFFAVESGWSQTLRFLSLEPYNLEVWHLLLAFGLGVAGAVLGTLFKISALATRALAAPLRDRPIIRSTMVGFALGLVGFALPLTLFLGTEGLSQVTEDPRAIGIGVIMVSAIVKLIATSGALSFGFIGGPTFPLLFTGGAFGSVLFVAAPDVPEALAVTALMAAVASAVIPAPFSLAVLTLLIGGIGATGAPPVFVAALVAFIVGRLIEANMQRGDRRLPPDRHGSPAS